MDPSRKRLLIGLAIAAGVVVIFLAGYLPGAAGARRAAGETRQSARRLAETEETLAKTRFDLDVARVRGRLGEVLHHTNANNYGVAAEHATAFFDGLRSAVSSNQLASTGARRTILAGILARRDEISGDLARADPVVKAKLAEMYMELGQAVE